MSNDILQYDLKKKLEHLTNVEFYIIILLLEFERDKKQEERMKKGRSLGSSQV
jgi:hypothetical protein